VVQVVLAALVLLQDVFPVFLLTQTSWVALRGKEMCSLPTIIIIGSSNSSSSSSTGTGTSTSTSSTSCTSTTRGRVHTPRRVLCCSCCVFVCVACFSSYKPRG